MPEKMWIGSIAPSVYSPLRTILSYGDIVDVPDDVLESDPDRWGDKPVKAKPGKAPDDNAEVEG